MFFFVSVVSVSIVYIYIINIYIYIYIFFFLSGFSSQTLVFTRLLLDEIYHLIELQFDWLIDDAVFVCLLDELILGFSYSDLTWETGGFELVSSERLPPMHYKRTDQPNVLIAPNKFQMHATAGIYLLKVNNRNSRTRFEICSKLTIKTPERCQLCCSDIFIVNFFHTLF